LIYYGKAGQVWFQYQKGELDKRPGLVATMREQARHSGWSDFIYVTNPDTVDKKLFSTPKALFVKHFGPFQPELLKPFVESLRT
jgi:hypothetical protein